MVQMPGWLRDDAARASRWKRSSVWPETVIPSGRTLMATTRSRRVSMARYTSPMPPEPSGAMISYGPRRAPADRGMKDDDLSDRLLADKGETRVPARYHGAMIRDVRISINGRSTRYLEAGAGWPLILLHAFPLNADMWRPQLERVPAGWRMIAPDLRGFGTAAESATAALDSGTRDGSV